jgi:hypothetical protein
MAHREHGEGEKRTRKLLKGGKYGNFLKILLKNFRPFSLSVLSAFKN